MNKVVFIGDLYRGNQFLNIIRICRVFSPVFDSAGIPYSIYISKQNKIVDESIWFPFWKDSLLKNVKSTLNELELENVSIIGFEISAVDIDYLNKKKVPWVNIAIHPLRFLDDLYFDITTSLDFDFTLYAVNQGTISFCVNYLKTRYGIFDTEEKPVTTLAIFGQSPGDKSVFFGDRFYSLEDYIPNLDKLASIHDKIIYRPHPYASNKELDDLIFNKYNAVDGSCLNVYEFLASGNIKTASAISSSIITEAACFGIKADFLDKRAQKFGPAISYKKLLGATSLWGKLINKQVDNGFSETIPNNYLRQVFASWGYLTREDEVINACKSLDQRASEYLELTKDSLDKALETEKNTIILADAINKIQGEVKDSINHFGNELEEVVLERDQLKEGFGNLISGFKIYNEECSNKIELMINNESSRFECLSEQYRLILNRIDTQVNTLSNIIKGKDEQIQSLHQKYEDCFLRNINAEKLYKETESNLAELNSRYDEIKNTLNISQQTVKSLELDNRELISQLSLTNQQCNRLKHEIEGNHHNLHVMEQSLKSWEIDFNNLTTQLNELLVQNSNLHLNIQNCEHRIHELNNIANNWHKLIVSIYESTSWRVTKPLRLIKRIAMLDVNYFVRHKYILRLKRLAHGLILKIAPIILNNKKLTQRIKGVLRRYPWLYKKILKIFMVSGVLSSKAHIDETVTIKNYFMHSENLDDLSSDAKNVYLKLKLSIEENKKEHHS